MPARVLDLARLRFCLTGPAFPSLCDVPWGLPDAACPSAFACFSGLLLVGICSPHAEGSCADTAI
jgi:hypothetical protein